MKKVIASSLILISVFSQDVVEKEKNLEEHHLRTFSKLKKVFH